MAAVTLSWARKPAACAAPMAPGLPSTARSPAPPAVLRVRREPTAGNPPTTSRRSDTAETESPRPSDSYPTGLRCVCGWSALCAVVRDSGSGFDSGQPRLQLRLQLHAHFRPRWFATSQRARSGLPPLGPLLPLPPPVARGEGGDTGGEAGSGEGKRGASLD